MVKGQRFSGRKKIRDIRRIVEEASAKYKLGRKMPIKTRLFARAWRLRNYTASLKRHTPLKAKNVLEFYSYYLPAVRHALRKPRAGPVVVAIGGIAGSGKTTLAKQLAEVTKRLHAGRELKVLTISLDSYFLPRAEVEIKDRHGRVIRKERRIGVEQTPSGEFRGGRRIDGEFDNPKASDLRKAIADLENFKKGKKVTLRERDVVTGKISYRTIDPRKYDVIIVEGLFTLHAPLASKADVRIGLASTIGQQFLARSRRDIEERKRAPNGVATKFIERAPYQRAFVLPTLVNADILIDVTNFRKSKYARAMPVRDAMYRTSFEELLQDLGLVSDYRRHPGWKKRTGNGKTPGLIPGRTYAERKAWLEEAIKNRSPKNIKIIRNTLLRDADTALRESCAEALGMLKDKGSFEALKEAIFEDPSWGVREAAIKALWESQTPEKYIPVLAEVLIRGGPEKLKAVYILYSSDFWDDKSGVPDRKWASLIPNFNKVPHLPDIIKEIKEKRWPMLSCIEDWKPEP
ncbi:MAG: HEAT repeat domain-containing protein [Candidatus Diapherotrites archaeon]|nr:HEAT repeat domain-containing protein [Candidatus Diapherotrites archaeon]